MTALAGHSATPAGEIRNALRAADRRFATTGPELAPWVEHYVGIPFAKRGYDRAGLHCWGLVCLVYSERVRIALPRHEDAYDDNLMSGEAKLHELRLLARAIDGRKSDWREIAWREARVLDVLLLPIGDALCHVALYAGDLHILHVEEGSETCCEDLRLGRLDARLRRAKLYRHHAIEEMVL